MAAVTDWGVKTKYSPIYSRGPMTLCTEIHDPQRINSNGFSLGFLKFFSRSTFSSKPCCVYCAGKTWLFFAVFFPLSVSIYPVSIVEFLLMSVIFLQPLTSILYKAERQQVHSSPTRMTVNSTIPSVTLSLNRQWANESSQSFTTARPVWPNRQSSFL